MAKHQGKRNTIRPTQVINIQSLATPKIQSAITGEPPTHHKRKQAFNANLTQKAQRKKMQDYNNETQNKQPQNIIKINPNIKSKHRTIKKNKKYNQ